MDHHEVHESVRKGPLDNNMESSLTPVLSSTTATGNYNRSDSRRSSAGFTTNGTEESLSMDQGKSVVPFPNTTVPGGSDFGSIVDGMSLSGALSGSEGVAVSLAESTSTKTGGTFDDNMPPSVLGSFSLARSSSKAIGIPSFSVPWPHLRSVEMIDMTRDTPSIRATWPGNGDDTTTSSSSEHKEKRSGSFAPVSKLPVGSTSIYASSSNDDRNSEKSPAG
eukprot:581094-Ditylum_brightwellii.AAC.1